MDLDLLRRETLDALVEHLAEEHIGVEEFERRVKTAREGEGEMEIRRALDGLPGRGSAGAA